MNIPTETVQPITHRHPHFFRCSAFLSLVVVGVFMGQSAQAQNDTWNGTGTSWQAAGSWGGLGIAPTSTTLTEFNSASYANMPTTGTTAGGTAAAGAIWVTNGVNQTITIGGTETLTIAGNLTVNGSANTAILLDDTTNNSSLTISAPLALSGSTSFDVNNAGTLTVGTVKLTTSTTLTLGGSGSTGNIVMGGVISGTTAGVTVNTSGTATLSGNNSYTGTTTLTAGTLVATGSTGALGAGTLSLGGGTLDLTNVSGTNLSFSRNTTLTANTQITSDVTASGAGDLFTLGTLAMGAQTLTVTGGSHVTSGTAGVTFGATTLSGNANFSVSNPTNGGNTVLSLGAVNAGANTITVGGTGTLALTGAGTFTSGENTTINSGGTLKLSIASALGAGVTNVADSGTLTVAAANSVLTLTGGGTVNGGSTLTVNPSGTDNFTGTITGAGGLTMAGAGTFVLSGSNNYTGSTSANAGTVQLNASAANTNIINSGANTGTLTGNSGATFDLNDQNATFGDLQGSETITNSDTAGFSATSTLTLTGTTGNTPGITGNITGNVALVVNISGTQELNGTGNTYSGGTIIEAGTLRLGASSNSGTVIAGTGAITLDGGNFLVSNSTSSVANNIVVQGATGNQITVNDGYSSNLYPTFGGTFTSASNATMIWVVQNSYQAILTGNLSGYNGTMDIESNASYQGSGNYYKQQRLSLYSSSTTQVGSTGAGSAQWILGAAASPAAGLGEDILDYSGAGNDTLYLGSLAGNANGLIRNETSTTASVATFSVGGLNTSTTYAGQIANLNSGNAGAVNAGGDTVALAKTGTGTLTLSGGNSFSAGTTLSGGGIEVNGGTATPTTTPITFAATTDTLTVSTSVAAGLVVGQAVTGTGINVGTVITGINTSTGVISLNYYTSAAETSSSITFNAVSGLGTGTVTVGGVSGGSAATTLSGTGYVQGAVLTSAANSNVAHIAAGQNTSGNFGSAGTLSLGVNGLSLGTGTNLDLDLASTNTVGGGVNDLISMAGGTLSIGSGLTVNLNELNSSLLTGAGTGSAYTLISGFTNNLSLSGTTFTTTGDGGLTASYSVDLVGSVYALEVNFAGATPAVAYFNGTSNSINASTSSNFDTAYTGNTAISGPLASSTDVYFAASRNASTSPNLTSAVSVNSINFYEGATGTQTGITLSSSSTTDTLTIEGGTTTNDTNNAGITINTNGGSDTISAPIALGATQQWTVASSGTLTVSGGINGSSTQTLTLNGPGSFNFASGSSTGAYSTKVNQGSSLYVSNGTTGSALGTGTLIVQKGATFGGAGAATGLSSFALGSGGSGTTQAQVGSGGTNTSTNLVLTATGASTIANANLTFNLNAAAVGGSGLTGGSNVGSSGNELVVGNTAIAFTPGTVQLTLNMQNEPAIVAAYTPYVLIAGTGSTGTLGTLGSTQYSGLTLGTSTTANGVTTTLITGGLSLAFSGSVDSAYYGTNSYLVLAQTASGVDDIDVEVVPEPGTWAMMIGGLGALFFWQRRKSKVA